jgi:Na+/proline symporter
MSSLDSALGALSSSAVVDFYKPYFARDKDAAHYLRAGRVFAFGFGVLLASSAIIFSGREDLLQEAFDWASLIFGSMLGVFLLGVLTRRRGRDGANVVAMLTGVAILAALKIRQDATGEVLLAWPWWIVFGTCWTFGGGALFGGGEGGADASAMSGEKVVGGADG